jgi:hypothetical protein
MGAAVEYTAAAECMQHLLLGRPVKRIHFLSLGTASGTREERRNSNTDVD